jgi:hypothetical protein
MKTFQQTVGQAVTKESILGEPEMLSAPYEFILSIDREDKVKAVKKKAREVKTKRTRKGNNLSSQYKTKQADVHKTQSKNSPPYIKPEG